MLEQSDHKKQEQDSHQINKANAISDRVIPILIQLSKKSRRYAVNYCKQRIGIVRPGVDCWIASASIQFGAIEFITDTLDEATNSLVNNFLKVSRSGIKFNASCNQCHYTIEAAPWLIKIDVFHEYCRASVVKKGRTTEYRYFPDLNSAIVCSFDLILNPRTTIGIRPIEEF